jgi:hypothetical protein
MKAQESSERRPMTMATRTQAVKGLHLIEQAYRAFRRDLPQLLEERAGQWVAYHGSRGVGLAATKAELYQECLRSGLKRGEFLMRSIEPELGEVVMGPWFVEADSAEQEA